MFFSKPILLVLLLFPYYYVTITHALSTSSSSASSSSISAATSTPTWLAERLATFDLQVHDFPTTGRGLQTSRPRKPGDVVLTVPFEEAITVDSLLQRYPLLAQAAEYHMAQFDDSKLTDEQILALGLLFLRQEQDRYVVSLPPQYSVLTMPTLLLDCLPRSYQKLIFAYQRHCLELRASLLAGIPQDMIDSIISQEDFLWAFATVRSRCVGMDGTDDPRIQTGGTNEIRVLLPGFDLLNHQFGAQSAPGFDESLNSYVLKSNDAYQAGEQVFISYSDQRDNLKMIMTYGFCLPNNPQAVLFWDVHDLLEACAAARSQYFTSTVLDQLWGLMEKLNKQRELYVWDARTQAPQESLRLALEMMAGIEQQFLTEPDAAFAMDLLNALLSARQHEIKDGLKRLQTLQETDQISSEWIPMMQSIKVLLQEEARFMDTTSQCDAAKNNNEAETASDAETKAQSK